MPTIPSKTNRQNSYTKLSGNRALIKCIVTEIIDNSNAPGKSDITLGKNGFVPEICLTVNLESGKYTYTKYLYGNYEWEKDKISGKELACKGWLLKKNQVYDFLSELSDNIVLNDDFTLQAEYLKSLIGSEVYILRYPDNEGKLRDYWMIKKATEQNKLLLLNTFESYPPKNYKFSNNIENEENDETDNEVPF